MEEVGKPISSPQQIFRLGVQHLEAGRWSEAQALYHTMAAQWPDNPDIHHNLGAALKNLRKLEEAVASLRTALALRPNYPEALINLADALADMNRPAEAMEAYQRGLSLRPNFPEGWNNLGIMLRQANQPAQAVDAYRRALRQRGNFALAWNNLAGALKDVGQLDEAVACYDRGIALAPNHPVIHGGRLCMLHFHPGYDAMAIFRESRRWNDQFARPLAGQVPVHDNERSPDRQLRIGYISPDFRRHCLSLFTLPLLSHHDRHRFEIFGYSCVAVPDTVTARLQRQTDAWRDISGLTDQAAANLIRQDKIDILVEITLHMTGNRLLLLARKPAPIQVTWLGYPGTTGLDVMDYRVTDPRLDPGDSGDSDLSTREPYYSERTVRLPDTFWCYDPRATDENPQTPSPDPGPLPALAAGHITFGCLNNFCKVTDPTLKLWSRVMAAVPDSHLILLSPPGPHRERVVQKLGVSNAGRVQFVAMQPRWQYLETYQRIDLCLDTIPYNGHTTSLDSLWMGVPVVTRVGTTVVGRAGWSQLYNLGLTELAAWTDDQFVKLAVELAGDVDRLKHLRATLRRRMELSSLMDAPRFARNMEDAYRQMWRAWCLARS